MKALRERGGASDWEAEKEICIQSFVKFERKKEKFIGLVTL